MKKKIKIKDVARVVGVSPATVSQAFNHPREVNRKTRARVLEVGEQLGYVHHKPLRKRRKNISVVALDRYVPFSDFYAYVSVGLLDEANRQGFNLIIEPFGQEGADLPLALSKNLVDGVIVLGPLPRENVLALKQMNLPLVLCGHPIPGLELHTVLPDGRAGMYEAAKHLLALGHKKIALITGGPIFDPVVADRLEGYRFALFEANLEIPKEYIVRADLIRYDTSFEAAEKLLALPDPPTAIICVSDPIAFRVYDHLAKKGFRVPQDISLVGFDDLPASYYSAPFLPEITTVHVDAENMGRTAVSVLLDVMKNPSRTTYRHTLPVHLAIKKSSASPQS